MDPDLSAALTRIVKTLQDPSPEFKQLAAVAGEKGLFLKINKWSTMLRIFVKAIDYEENKKRLSNVEVKLWLDDVKELADDVEEILEEISKQASRLKFMAQTRTTVGKKSSLKGLISSRFRGSSTSAVMLFDKSLRSRIITTSSRLEKLNSKIYALGLIVIFSSSWLPETVLIHRSRYLSIPESSPIYGREKDKEEILKLVLRDETSDHANFSIIPIIGAAGIGKTTLTRLVYGDRAVANFKPRAWVSVYEDSNVLRISKAILESITSKSCNLNDLDEVLIKLKQAIFGRKFLFVLDDVWTKNHDLWVTLESSFMAAAQGSKIIVTTRNVDIQFPVDLNIQPYPLEALSDEACWSVFQEHLFKEGVCDIGLIREKVVDMCKGLPLAAFILAALLKRNEWNIEREYILDSKIWDLADDNEILPVLKLSYQYLSLQLERCFTYCALLPDGYEFEEKELVLLWIAEGLIGEAQDDEKIEDEPRMDKPLEDEHTEVEQVVEQSSEDVRVKYQSADEPSEDEQMHDEELEDRGRKLFHELLQRCLFQDTGTHAFRYKMHYLVKNMAQWIYEESDFRLEEVLGDSEQQRRFERACHADTSASCDGKNKFELYYDVENLGTFFPGLIRNDDSPYITDALLSDLLPKFKRLRALCLEKQDVTKLPNSIEGLRYLRYVNLSSTMIRRLPDSICSLVILQSLLLRDCSCLEDLPSNLWNLINLRHLDITGANLIREMPLGMKELECLRTLLNIVVGKGAGSDLKDLKNLKYLRELHISRLQNVTDSQDTKDSILVDKKGLRVLVLEWDCQLDDTRDESVEEKVLDMLQPHSNLKELTIKGYAGTKFSFWVGDPTYSNLVVLTLESCERCTVLPSLGCLTSLKHLKIKGMTGIKSIGSEISSRSLNSLCFEDMQEWEHWDPIEENMDVQLFSDLRELSLVKCPKLRAELPEHFHLYWLLKLRIQECEQLVVSFPDLFPICDAEVDGCKMLCGSEVDTSTSDEFIRPNFFKACLVGVISCMGRMFNWRRATSDL